MNEWPQAFLEGVLPSPPPPALRVSAFIPPEAGNRAWILESGNQSSNLAFAKYWLVTEKLTCPF